jgi:hypothetical protein
MASAPPRTLHWAALLGCVVGAAICTSDEGAPFFRVPSGHRGVVFNRLRGVRKQSYSDGWHSKTPLFERVILMDVRPQTIACAPGHTYTTRDRQEFKLCVTAKVQLQQEHAVWVFQTLGADWEQRIVPSILHEATRATVVTSSAMDITGRPETVAAAIEAAAVTAAAKFHVDVFDVALNCDTDANV